VKKDQPEASAGRVDNKSKSPIQEREASRKQAKEALRQSEEFLRTTFDYASVGMAIGAPDQTFVQTNAAFNRMLGYEPGELTGVHWSAVTPPEDVAQTEDRYHRFVQSGMPSIAFEKRYVRKDGTVIWTDANVSLVRDTEGNAKFAIATVQDITERKRAEEALVRAKEEWERTFATVPDLIAILDNQHRVVRVNQAMAGRFGASPEECIGLRCYEVVHGLPEPPEFCPHSRTMKDGQQHIAEVHEERLGGDFVVSTTIRER